MGTDHADPAVVRDLVDGRQVMVDLAGSAISGEEDRAVPFGVGHELAPASGDESVGDILQRAPDRSARGLQLPAVRDEPLTGGRVKACIELREGHRGGRPNPAPFTSSREGHPYEPAY